MLGRRGGTGGAVEVVLLAERPDVGPDHWETLVRPDRRLREGSRMVFGDENGMKQAVTLCAEILQRTEAGGRIVHFWVDGAESPAAAQGHDESRHHISVRELIEQLGRMPLPPYIHEALADPERYQTVYARITRSAAAPTAGLHFTPPLLEPLRRQRVRIGFVTLHVGLDTFRPIESDDIREHKMHTEAIDLDIPTAELLNETRRAAGRVVTVGTTAVRVLESVASFYKGKGR